MKIYSACFTDCIFKSAYYALSIHKTKYSAEQAIEKHKTDWIGANGIEYIDHVGWTVNENILEE